MNTRHASIERIDPAAGQQASTLRTGLLDETINQVRRQRGPAREGLCQPSGPSLMVLVGGDARARLAAASTIAAELELERFRIDLSSVVGKYIGETERNLSLRSVEPAACSSSMRLMACSARARM